MDRLEDELAAARAIEVGALADVIEDVGFECTRCGACCTAEGDDPHTATVFPDEIRSLQAATGEEWADIARPMPFGLDGAGHGETFEWALQTEACGDCVFYEEADDLGACSVHEDRPLICRTYPFSLDVGAEDVDAVASGADTDMGAVVERRGPLEVHECEGVGRHISREDALALAETVKRRTIRELEEAIGVREQYDPAVGQGEPVVVHDSEGAKRPDGSEIGASGE